MFKKQMHLSSVSATAMTVEKRILFRKRLILSPPTNEQFGKLTKHYSLHIFTYEGPREAQELQ